MAEQASSANDEGLEMLSRLFEEEMQQEMLEQLILPVPSSVEELLHQHYEDVLARNEELESRVAVMEQENKTLQQKNDLLRNNLTTLYRMSLAKIRFQNLQIASLRKQLQSTVAERRISSDSDQSVCISKQSMGSFHGIEGQGSVPRVSRTEMISSLPDCSSKEITKTDIRRHSTSDTCLLDWNVGVSSSCSLDCSTNNRSSFSHQLSSSNTVACGLTVSSSVISGTDVVSVHALGVGNEVLVSSGATMTVQPAVPKRSLLESEDQKSHRCEPSQNTNAISVLEGALHLPCSSESCSACNVFAFQGVESEPCLLPIEQVKNSDLTTNSLQDDSSSGVMLKVDREEKSKAKENSFGEKSSVETKTVNHELLDYTAAVSMSASGASKSSVTDSKRNTPSLANKEFQSNFIVHVKPKETSLHLAKNKNNQKTADVERDVSSERVDLTGCLENRNDRKISSTVQLKKTDTSKQTKGILSNSWKKFRQSDFHSTPGNKSEDSVISNTTRKEILVGKSGVAKEISFSLDKTVEENRTREISSSYTGQKKDSLVEENEQVESSSHSGLQKTDSVVEKPQSKEVEPKKSKTASENVGKCCETSESGTLPDNDLRLKLTTESSCKLKADVLHLERASAPFNSRFSKSKKKRFERELETSSGRQGIHKEHSIAENTAASGQSVHSSHQEKLRMEENSSLSGHRSHRTKSEIGEAAVSSQSAKVHTRDDFRKQESVIKNDDQRQTSTESDNSKRMDDTTRKRKLSCSDAELPTKKSRSDESIQERLLKMSTLSHSVSEQPGFPPEENSWTATHDQRKCVTLASNAKKIQKTPELISRLVPEIEQLKRYIGMAERHDVAQKISQREAQKHMSSLVVEKKMLDSERVEDTAPVKMSLQPASGSSQKKPLSDSNVPSLTIFTMRSMAKLKQASLSRTDKQVTLSMEKERSKQDYRVLTFGEYATNNPPEVKNLITSSFVLGNSNTVSMETSLPKLACSSQNETLMVTSENSDISAVMQHSPQNKEDRSIVNTDKETSGMQSSCLKKPAHRKPAQSEISNAQAVQGVISNTPISIQSVETSKPWPSEDTGQKKLNSQRRDLVNKTNISGGGGVSDSHTGKRNKEVKGNVRQLLDGLFISRKNTTHLDTKQNDDVETVSQAEHRGSGQESADISAEYHESPNNFSQASKSFSKLLCTPVEVNSDLHLGAKISKATHKKDSVRNAFSGEEALSDFDVGVPQTESDSQNHSFDFLFDVAITGATPAHVGDFENENTNISFDQDFFANFVSLQSDNSTAEITETRQGSLIHVMAGEEFLENESNVMNCNQSNHAINDVTENLRNTRNLKQKLVDKARNSERDDASNVVAETQIALEDGNGQVETTVMIDDVFSSNPSSCSNKEMDLAPLNLLESHKHQNPWMQRVDKEFGDNETYVKNLDISHKVRKWPTADVELLLDNENQDEDPSPQSIPFKVFLHNSDAQSENGFSTPEEPSSSFSSVQHLLKDTANLSPAKNKKALQSDGAYSDSELLQVHAPEENFDLYQSDTNDRLFGSVSESPSSFKSPDLEDGAEGGVSKTEMKAKESLNCLEVEEGEISDSEKGFSVGQGKQKNSTWSGQVLHDERSRPGRLTKKRSFTGWHSHGHQYGKTRTGNFSRESTRSEVKQIQINAGSQMEQNSKARNPPRSRSPEMIASTQSSKKGRSEELEDDAVRHSKKSKDRTHSQERDRSRHSQEHSSGRNHHKHRQRSRDYHSNTTRRSRVAKRRQTKS